MFRVANCRSDMTVRELKEELDLMVGIPLNLQRLQYLDEGVLMDNSTLKFHDVAPGGVISLCIWHYDGWTELVLAAVEGDPSKLSCLGISEESFYRTANSQNFQGERWKQWTSQRACVALYITSHRGHVDTVRYLLEHGADCLGRTPLGRTPLHVVAAMGRLDCIGPLLEYGASIHDRDARGETPIAIARRLKRRQSERTMFLLYWLAKSGAKDPNDLLLKEVLQKGSSSGKSKKSSPSGKSKKTPRRLMHQDNRGENGNDNSLAATVWSERQPTVGGRELHAPFPGELRDTLGGPGCRLAGLSKEGRLCKGLRSGLPPGWPRRR
nr:ankyrin repeat domain-containing protein 60 [Jaculus jaculus]